jgi:hypothetical protein
MRTLVWLWILVWMALAPIALGNDRVTLALKGSRVISGVIVGLHDGKVVVDSDTGRIELPFSELTPGGASLVAARIVAQSADSLDQQLQLAELELRMARWDFSRKALDRALVLDDSFVTREQVAQLQGEVDRLEARALYQQAIDLHQQGDAASAGKVLEALLQRFSATPYADAARKLQAVIATAGQPDDPAVKADPEPATPDPAKLEDLRPDPDPKTAPPPNARLRALQRALDELEALRKSGMEQEAQGKDVRAQRDYELALEKIETVERFARQLAEHEDPATAQGGSAALETLPVWRERFHLLLAQLLARTSQYRKATYHVNQILISNPQHPQALALRETITLEQVRRLRVDKDK